MNWDWDKLQEKRQRQNWGNNNNNSNNNEEEPPFGSGSGNGGRGPDYEKYGCFPASISSTPMKRALSCASANTTARSGPARITRCPFP